MRRNALKADSKHGDARGEGEERREESPGGATPACSTASRTTGASGTGASGTGARMFTRTARQNGTTSKRGMSTLSGVAATLALGGCAIDPSTARLLDQLFPGVDHTEAAGAAAQAVRNLLATPPGAPPATGDASGSVGGVPTEDEVTSTSAAPEETPPAAQTQPGATGESATGESATDAGQGDQGAVDESAVDEGEARTEMAEEAVGDRPESTEDRGDAGNTDDEDDARLDAAAAPADGSAGQHGRQRREGPRGPGGDATHPLTTTVTTKQPGTGPATPTTAEVRALAVQFFDLINEERASVGLRALSVDATLSNAALAQTGQIEARGSLFHQDLHPLLDLGFRTAGENVGVGPGVLVLHDAFVASPGHYANIVNPAFTRLGVGVLVDADGTIWVAMVFGG